MSKKMWLDKMNNRTDAGNWEYSKLTKTVVEEGSPEKFVSNIFSDGEKTGVLITAATIITVEAIVAGFSWSIYKYKEYKKKKIEEYSKKLQDDENLE